MGFFSKKVSYPELDSASPAAAQIQEVEQPLKTLIGQVSDPLEVVPDDGQAYVFIGKPPKKFGLAVIEDGEAQNFVAIAKEKGHDNVSILKINEKFRDAYTEHMDVQRFKASVAGKDVVVTPSAQLAQEVREIVNSL